MIGFAFRNVRTGTIDAPYWSVEFYSDRLPWARVVVSRRTGRATAERYGNELGMPFAEFCPAAA